MRHRSTRRAVLGAGLGALAGLAGCSGQSLSSGSGGDGGDSSAGGDGETGGDDATSGGDDDAETPTTTAGSVPLSDAALPVSHELSTLRDEEIGGGPGKDGIPSIDDPSFVDPAGADEFLAADDPVFGVAMNGAVKAYPQKILVWHEITNDTLGDTPVSVTYCPLTGTAMGFFRGETTFGVSGKLVNNNLVMYDRATDSRWPQVLGTAIRGKHEGKSLEEFRLIWTSWGDWRETHPETRVLSKKTGYARDYTRDPYGSYNPREDYYADDDKFLFAPLRNDDRLGGKEVVIGTRSADYVGAFQKSTLREQGVVAAADAGVVAVHDPALDTGYVYRNPDGATVERAGGEVLVDGTGAQPAELPLDRLYAFDGMWFAWAGFYPEIELHA